MQIFICGDSTAASYNPEETQMVGWGQLLGNHLPAVTVVNLAMAGRSTKTFLQEHRLDPVSSKARPGDLMLVQFAHNDENEKKPERYVPLPAFRENLSTFVRFARELKLIPVLLTPICMRVWQGGALQPTHGEYPAAAVAVADALSAVLRQRVSPVSPVAALAIPALTTTARTVSPARRSCLSQMTGAALTTLRVKVPARWQGASLKIRAMSLRP